MLAGKSRRDFDSNDAYTVQYRHNKTGVLEALTYDTTDLRESFADAKRRIDADDFNNEIAGRETSRIPRFLSADERDDRREGRSSQGRRTENLSRLQILLASNPGYAAVYTRTFDAMRDAEAATERALARAAVLLEKAQQKLQATLDKAASLPDGTRVFRDKRGQVWNERGQRVSDLDAAGIVWRGDEPAYEQFLEDSESVRGRLTVLEDLQGYRVDVLGRIRDRMTDETNPPSTEELERFGRELGEKMPEAVRQEMTHATASIPVLGAEVVAPIRTL